ncbi:hypothetical protein [Brachybacterium tyrofermentans]|uniref:hypothetical protein n=1 Tax=Brachybacterium tyrofermentans TaxID=47848 RepID=UPI0031D4DB5D
MLELLQSWRQEQKWFAPRIGRELAGGHGFAYYVRTVTWRLNWIGLNPIRYITPDGEKRQSPAKMTAPCPDQMLLDVEKIGKSPDGG